jgi:hypothetical protein
VAVNLYTIRVDKGPAGEFFRKLNSQFVQYQGLYLAAPDGKLLVKKQMWKSEDVLAGLKEGLRAFGPVKPRKGHSEYLARRGCGTDKDGGIILSVSTKLLFVPQLPQDLADLNVSAIPSTGHDRILLTAAELDAVVPAGLREGGKWTVPDATARQFFPVLDNWDKRFHKTDEVTAVHLAGRVRAVRHGIAYLSFEGDIAGTHVWPKEAGPALAGKTLRSELKLLAGVGAYDVEGQKLLSLTLVFDGRAGDSEKLRTPGPDGRYGAVAEWRRDRGVRR